MKFSDARPVFSAWKSRISALRRTNFIFTGRCSAKIHEPRSYAGPNHVRLPLITQPGHEIALAINTEIVKVIAEDTVSGASSGATEWPAASFRVTELLARSSPALSAIEYLPGTGLFCGDGLAEALPTDSTSDMLSSREDKF